MYIVTSKPKRISVYSGLVHMVLLLGDKFRRMRSVEERDVEDAKVAFDRGVDPGLSTGSASRGRRRPRAPERSVAGCAACSPRTNQQRALMKTMKRRARFRSR
jgi:hypothetical protein